MQGEMTLGSNKVLLRRGLSGSDALGSRDATGRLTFHMLTTIDTGYSVLLTEQIRRPPYNCLYGSPQGISTNADESTE
jgi:hypothetical protein